MMKKDLKIALVHDFLLNYGGAERVLFALKKIYPEADIFTLLFDEQKMSEWFDKSSIKTSFLNKLPNFLKKRHKFLLPFFPMAIESFDLSGYDLVISSSSIFAKGVVTNPDTLHICYCHSPARFLWDYNERYLKDEKIPFFLKPFVKFIIHKLRIWDSASAERVDFWIANSNTTKKRIKKYYKKDSKIIYPPVSLKECEESLKLKERNYFLVVTRLSPYKKVDVIIEAFNKLELPLVIVGEGRDFSRLRKLAKGNIKFLGFLPDEKLACCFSNCKAFIIAHEEDFGIAPIEAMLFGKPVLAFKKGGAEEWLKEGINGEFFESQIPEVLADGVRRIQNGSYDPKTIKKEAEKFSFENFKNNIKNFISEL